MKLFYCLIILVAAFIGCSPKIGSKITMAQPSLPDTSFVLVLQQQDPFENDGIDIGTIKSGDNGFSTNCTYYEVIETLRQLARQNGANVIKIIAHKSPDHWSTCERLTAKIYRVPDFRKHEREIEWSASRKLVMEDFKGMPKVFSNPTAAAQTFCGFSFQTNYITLFSKTKIFTNNTFNCQLSWVRPDQKDRTDLLEHEQGHFDLCEIYTRRLRRELVEKKLTAFSVSTDATTVLKDVYAQYLERQELYEKETNYGLDSKMQKYWNVNIERELRHLQDYAH